jgi:hypothetical protein
VRELGVLIYRELEVAGLTAHDAGADVALSDGQALEWQASGLQLPAFVKKIPVPIFTIDFQFFGPVAGSASNSA